MRSVLLVLAAAVCFGTTGTAQALGPDADPLSLGTARILIGGGALAAVALSLHLAGRRGDATGTSVAPALGGSAPGGSAPGGSATGGRTPRLVPALAVLVGAAGVLAYQPAFFAGTAANGVAVGTVVALGSAPVLTGALDWALRRRFPGRAWIVATVLATTGVGILAAATGTGTGPSGVDPLGVAASVGAGASYAVYTLAGKSLLDRGWNSSASMGAIFGVAAAASLPMLLMTDTSWLAAPDGLAMALWLGLVTTTVAYLMFGAGLRRLAPATVSTLTLAEPLTATLLGVLVLQEQLPATAIAGLGVLASGIMLLAVSSSLPMPRRGAARAASPAPADVGGAA
ncbi:EamA family transporter [Agromyces aurantiacus]|uniref:EamA family transporter n=1 Tax=Agromyces aurantiacus TaxID=165814 RepID=A0ABV9R0W7_9MICO|nr:EamA family transporter [Agromyces aurantiacus]MBM7505814.1 DME family drug/metabolite transporter [Agromyces aurantiacus]